MLKNKVEKITTFMQKKGLPVLTGVAVGSAMVLANGALAAGGAEELIAWAIRALGVLVLVPGIFQTVMGVIAYANAHAEGDGPAESKATKKLSGGIMLFVVSVILIAAAPTLAGMISTTV